MESVRNTDQAYYSFRDETTHPTVPINTVGSKALQININLPIKIGKVVPLQAWSGPHGSRKLRFPDFMTTAQDGGKVVSLTYRPPLPPGNTLGTHFC
jgi:hypothetical protein